jgi:squalene synthase HpnC
VIQRAFGRPRAVPEPVPQPPEPLELDACYRYCEALARARHHNFPVASLFLSSRLRKHIFAVYAFARTADDIADEPAYEGRRLLELDRWEEHLEGCFHGEPPSHPVFVALADTIARFDLPITPFQDLMAGFRADLEVPRYATYAEVRALVEKSAEPVAHIFLYLSGYRDPVMLRFGGDFAAGLAFANMWQDLADDLARGRRYLPDEDLRHFGLTADTLSDPAHAGDVTALIRFEVARTRALFEHARPLIDRAGDDIAAELAIAWHGGMRILDKLHGAGARVLSHRPRLTSYDKAVVVSRAMAWRGGSLGRRARRRALRLAQDFRAGHSA